MFNIDSRTPHHWLLVTLLLVTLSGCGGGGSGGSGGGGGPTGGATPTITYTLTYSANTTSTNLYINGAWASNGSSEIRTYNSGTVLALTFDDTYTVGADQYQADTYKINNGTPQAVLPGGINLTMDGDYTVVITYTIIPSGP